MPELSCGGFIYFYISLCIPWIVYGAAPYLRCVMGVFFCGKRECDKHCFRVLCRALIRCVTFNIITFNMRFLNWGVPYEKHHHSFYRFGYQNQPHQFLWRCTRSTHPQPNHYRPPLNQTAFFPLISTHRSPLGNLRIYRCF